MTGSTRTLDELRDTLMQNGAGKVGFTRLERIDSELRKQFKTGISILVALDPAVVREITEGPTMRYYEEYGKTNLKLDGLSRLAGDFLNARGFLCEYWGATNDRIGEDNRTPLPHKTIATLSGHGWIGKCALLVTPEFGSALRMTSVLTQAEYEGEDRSVSESQCGECRVCVELCPGKAPNGRQWKRGMEREEIFDAGVCRSAARKLAIERTGIDDTFCGICIANCPYTRSYIGR